ncbi:MAG: protein kinase [Acidobacteria bacterium]|nr:protein kinase [Acidobacteriota bacterium]
MPVGLVSEGRIGRFDLRGLLGRGGSGDVHLAYDPDRGSLIALKLIRIGLDPEMLEAERRGVALQQRLQPKVPQIAAIFDFGEIDGFFFVAMEFIEGVDLAEILKPGRLAPAKAVDVATQLCTILESMERVSKDLEEKGRRVIHSDIKPANVRLQEGDRVRLLDFGVAKSVTLSKKFTRNVFGSTPYLAPERLSSEVVDSHTDLWAVSVVLYEMIAGYVPFPGETTDAIERRIRSGQPPAPLPADCPAALKSILLKCLRTEPALRFPDAATLRRHLEAFRAGRPLAISEPTRKIPHVRQETAPPPAPEQRPKLSRSERHRRGARRWRMALGMALLLVLAGALASCGYAWSEGKAIEKTLVEPGADLTALYARYRQAGRYDPFGLCLSGAAQALKGAFAAVADRTLGRFRTAARVERQDWEDALRWLRAAAELVESDESVQARITFCEGQLTRLDAEALFGSNPEGARQKWQEALQSFERSKSIAPELVEVYMALASMYGDPRTRLQDTKKLREALDEAERRGAGRSERGRQALLEAYVREARQASRRASRAQGQERIDLLYKALDGYDGAVNLCKDLRSGTPAACREAQEQQTAVGQELAGKGQV